MTIMEPTSPPVRLAGRPVYSSTLQWTPIIAGALTASAISSILVTFAATVGLGVSSAAPTWRDASVALWLLSGIFLILQALISFGCGGYIAGRTRVSDLNGIDGAAHEDIERHDGRHGIIAWALAVVLGGFLAALIGFGAIHQTSLTSPNSTTEPSVISYEIDQLFRAPRRPPTLDLAPVRAEAGRILLKSSSHVGITVDERTYLSQLVTLTTGLTGADADRRVDTAIVDAKTAVSHTRASTIILAFSIATALLIGAVASWAGAEQGGRHRDGMPMSSWMVHSNRWSKRRSAWERTPRPLPE